MEGKCEIKIKDKRVKTKECKRQIEGIRIVSKKEERI